jgi:hypothetical protein
MATVSAFDDGLPAPHAEIAFDNGEKVSLQLERGGLTITNISDGSILYRTDAATVARMCAALASSPGPLASPLKMLVALVAQMHAADEVRSAFRAADAAVRA